RNCRLAQSGSTVDISARHPFDATVAGSRTIRLRLRERSTMKRIALLSDGTGNAAAKVWRTNGWRTFEGIDLLGSDQIGFYDDGVGGIRLWSQAQCSRHLQVSVPQLQIASRLRKGGNCI